MYRKRIYVFHKNRIRVTKLKTTKKDDVVFVLISGTRQKKKRERERQ